MAGRGRENASDNTSTSSTIFCEGSPQVSCFAPGRSNPWHQRYRPYHIVPWRYCRIKEPAFFKRGIVRAYVLNSEHMPVIECGIWNRAKKRGEFSLKRLLLFELRCILWTYSNKPPRPPCYAVCCNYISDACEGFMAFRGAFDSQIQAYRFINQQCVSTEADKAERRQASVAVSLPGSQVHGLYPSRTRSSIAQVVLKGG